ncbi:hypothetical protein M9Y10_029870 [Tritrichomonas musculus]|uniref:Protein kinase domain-containing protein n=1 Tax=Tritrichomonas musculus TaxID=1915356 RepID=A0ABR2KNJ0_9EUKA
MNDNDSLKFIILGENAVGKSCLILRYTDNKYQETYVSTIGVDFKTKRIDIDGKQIKLLIWDTAGQERFRLISKAYYRGSHGILVVFDISQRDTFNQIRKWMDSIKDYCNNQARVILIGNKSDLERSVTKEEAQDLASQYKIPYIETSAKDNINVDLAFQSLANESYNYFIKKIPDTNNFVPKTDPIIAPSSTDSISSLKLKIKDLEAQLANKNKESEEKASLLKEIQKLKEERNSFSKEENDSLKSENKKLKEENELLKSENAKLDEKAKKYKNYLLAIKEKNNELTFVDLDDYEEESVIGEGSTSTVKIVHKKTFDKYAKKELILFDYKSIQRFIKESEILFILRHPCIIRVYGLNYGDKTHKPSIILSLEPKSLEIAIKNKELDECQKNRITVELVLGMRYIHRHNFMHRDLKPMNILLSKNSHVRITDFGLAKEEDLETSLTKGEGTLRFMAPELFEESDTDYTKKVDVYSFGIILIFIVTDNYPPFGLKRVLNGVPPSLPENIAKWVRELIISCLSVTADSRPSFEEIYQIMKANNFDLFSDSKNKKLSKKQQMMKEMIESRVMKIEAFEFQHQ